ncbi:hypothetical protein ACFPM0_34565 [Pseudonocardia sulfidoxydans]|uniref:hypothetical protein n=1 Tax=Pseudonocardia sulfidoxydans TaxID=54011 RepID=UPI00361917CE
MVCWWSWSNRPRTPTTRTGGAGVPDAATSRSGRGARLRTALPACGDASAGPRSRRSGRNVASATLGGSTRHAAVVD